jgi:hypothetical protein
MTRLRAFAVAVALPLLVPLTAATAAETGAKPPRSGWWKVIPAEFTPRGYRVLGGASGSFKIADGAVEGFHLSFEETADSPGCAAGKLRSGKGEGRSGSVRFAPGESLPIVQLPDGGFAVSGSAESAAPAQVRLITPGGRRRPGSIAFSLTREGGEPRSGMIGWHHCAFEFLVRPR